MAQKSKDWGITWIDKNTWITGTAGLGTRTINSRYTFSSFDSDHYDLQGKTRTGYVSAIQILNSKPIASTKELWIQFDFFIDNYKGNVNIYSYQDNFGIHLGGNSNNTAIKYVYQSDDHCYYNSLFVNGEEIDSYYVGHRDDCAHRAIKRRVGLHTIVFHAKSDEENGCIELWFDNKREFYFSGNVYNGKSISSIVFYAGAGGVGNYFTPDDTVFTGFSNLIVSNAPISPDTIVHFVRFGLDIKRTIIIPTDVILPIDVVRRIVNCIFSADITRNVLAEIIFSPLETEEIFQRGATRLKALKSGTALRDTGAITATSFDSNEVESNVTSLRNTIGLQSLEVHIAEQQLTDQVSFAASLNFAIMQYFDGQYFDYYYRLRIESRQQQGIIFTYRCCSNIDQLLYTQIAYKVTTTETVHDDTQEQASEESEEEKSIEEEEQELLATGEYHTLFDNAVAVATYFGLTPIVQLGEFAEFYSSYKEQDLWGRTYADAIREVFGWSSRIPHKMINVYIRGDKMFFIQRGSESNVIDISETAHTVPIINQELVRTFWGTTLWSKTEIKEKILGTQGIGGSGDNDDDFPADYINNEDDDDDKENPWTAVGSVVTSNNAGTSTTKYDYTSNGVLRGTTTTFISNSDESQNSTTVVRNSYNADGLLDAVQTTVTHPAAPEEDKQTVVKYGYLSLSGGQKFLASELTAEYERNSEGVFELVDTRATAKSPTGRGQGTSYDSKGKGTASGNVGDDRVTPYQLRSSFNTTEALSVQTLKRTTTTTINGFTDIDPSFPLLLLRDRATITEYLKWLNRKTIETVSVSVYDFGHIIDFNDRIVLDSNEYFVVNNTVRTTPRLYNEQNLTLARWF